MVLVATDIQLWDKFRAGDRPAYEAIYDRYVQTLYNYGCKITTDRSLVQDLIQDLFLEIWNNRQRLGPTDSIKFYLFRSLRRKLARAVLRAGQHRAIDECLADQFGLTLDPESLLIDEQRAENRKAHLDRALSRLTRRQKEAIYLRFYQGLSYEEVAQVMSLEMKSTYNLVSRTLEILRVHLKKTSLVALSITISVLINFGFSDSYNSFFDGLVIKERFVKENYLDESKNFLTSVGRPMLVISAVSTNWIRGAVLSRAPGATDNCTAWGGPKRSCICR